jgi:hypothetical protein
VHLAAVSAHAGSTINSKRHDSIKRLIANSLQTMQQRSMCRIDQSLVGICKQHELNGPSATLEDKQFQHTLVAHS